MTEQEWLAFFQEHAPEGTTGDEYRGLLRWVGAQKPALRRVYDVTTGKVELVKMGLPALAGPEQLDEAFEKDRRLPFVVWDLVREILYRSGLMNAEHRRWIDRRRAENAERLRRKEEEAQAGRDRYIATFHRFLAKSGHLLTREQVDDMIVQLQSLRK